MFRRAVPISFALFLAYLLFPPPFARAQYLYLDANGDGIHDATDVLATTGVTTVDVWLVTDRRRDGTEATCTSEAGHAMTINSYEIILHADGGSVAYGAFENGKPEWSTRLGGPVTNGIDYYVGFGGGTIEAPGKYRLGRITIEPQGGAPSIAVAPHTPLAPAGGTTFGCQCPGIDYDNTMKLGQDWFDADGLPTSGPPNPAPWFAGVSNLSLDEGTTAEQGITAYDADGDILTLTAERMPSYASFHVTSSTPGEIHGVTHFAPTYADAGKDTVVVACGDGEHTSTVRFTVTVRNVNHPPRFEAIPNVSVRFGELLDATVDASDVDGDPLTVRLAQAPPFVTLLGTAPVPPDGVRATLRIAPSAADGGVWTVSLVASDGTLSATGSFGVIVSDGSTYHAPVLDSIPDFALAEGDTVRHPVTAHDADDDFIALSLVDRPPFVFFELSPWVWPEPGIATETLIIAPRPGDAGEWQATIRATDTLYGVIDALTSERTFHITVADRAFPPRITPWSSSPCVEQGESMPFEIAVTDPDGDAVTASFGPPPSWGSSVDVSPTRRHYEFTPTSDDPPQTFPIAVHAEDATGLTSDLTVPVTLGSVGDCYRGGIAFGTEPTLATAEAGGPYATIAGAAAHFDAGGTQNPSGALVRYEWSFGDGTTGLGKTIDHRYPEGGVYRAVLTAWTVALNQATHDTATVTVGDALPARAFLAPGHRPIVLRSEEATLTMQLERVGDEYALQDIVPASLSLWSPGHGETDSIAAVVEKPMKIEDRDRNGSPELSVAFAKADLRRLFAAVRGRREVAARLQGALATGAYVRAPITLEVVGAPAKAVSVWPNPLNPRGVIAFEATRAGHVTVRLFDVGGRLVRTLLDRVVQPGEVRVTVDGVDARGRTLASGVYYFRVDAPDGSHAGRVTILR